MTATTRGQDCSLHTHRAHTWLVPPNCCAEPRLNSPSVFASKRFNSALAGDEKQKLKLYHDGSLFAGSRLQAALKGLGAFVGELGDLATRADGSFRLPHPITHGADREGVGVVPRPLPPSIIRSRSPAPAAAAGGERVGDLSVAPGGRDAAWTRAMKLLLTDLKWLLAWSSRLPE